MLFFYRCLFGFLEIEIYGIYPEKVLNLCEKNRISLWEIYLKKGKICCKINVKDFKKLPKIFKKQGIRIHILNRFGLPFFTNKYKMRFGVFVGLVLFLAILLHLSSFVWIIEVDGNKTVSKSEILSICNEIGIREGISKNSIDVKNKSQQLLLKSNKLSWASLNIEGCVLTVDVSEITPKIDYGTTPCNLVAACDGVIKYIDVTVGNCVVKVGDTVKAGDVLVSGIVEDEGATKFVQSRGKIIAQTITPVTLSQEYKIKETYLIAKQKTKSVLEVFTLKIPLYLGREKGSYDSEYTVRNLKLFGKPIPIKLHTKRFIFKEEQTIILNYETACEMLNNKILNDYPNAQIKKEFCDEIYKATLNVLVYDEKDITKMQKLIVSDKK